MVYAQSLNRPESTLWNYTPQSLRQQPERTPAESYVRNIDCGGTRAKRLISSSRAVSPTVSLGEMVYTTSRSRNATRPILAPRIWPTGLLTALQRVALSTTRQRAPLPYTRAPDLRELLAPAAAPPLCRRCHEERDRPRRRAPEGWSRGRMVGWMLQPLRCRCTRRPDRTCKPTAGERRGGSSHE
eukprot:scaffold303_cov410-Prasinococcus_capsulatus_cf.AAC.5